MHTGYLWEEIYELGCLKYVDVLVVGLFIKALKDTSYYWAGTTNQRIIDVQEPLKLGTVIERRY